MFSRRRCRCGRNENKGAGNNGALGSLLGVNSNKGLKTTVLHVVGYLCLWAAPHSAAHILVGLRRTHTERESSMSVCKCIERCISWSPLSFWRREGACRRERRVSSIEIQKTGVALRPAPIGRSLVTTDSDCISLRFSLCQCRSLTSRSILYSLIV